MLDLEKLILEIEKRPTLYDLSSKEYSNKHLKAECWTDVGRAMYPDWEERTKEEKDTAAKDLMKRWKTLRDTYVRELRILKKYETGRLATKKKTYKFFDHLSFLWPHVKGNETTSNNSPSPEDNYLKDEELEEDNISLPQDDSCSFDSLTHSSVTKRKKKQEIISKKARIDPGLATEPKNVTTLMQESIAIQNKNTDLNVDVDQFGNKAFLLSFVPFMDSLSPCESIDLRMKITEVIRNATIRSFTTNNEATPINTIMSNSKRSSNRTFKKNL